MDFRQQGHESNLEAATFEILLVLVMKIAFAVPWKCVLDLYFVLRDQDWKRTLRGQSHVLLKPKKEGNGKSTNTFSVDMRFLFLRKCIWTEVSSCDNCTSFFISDIAQLSAHIMYNTQTIFLQYGVYTFSNAYHPPISFQIYFTFFWLLLILSFGVPFSS